MIVVERNGEVVHEGEGFFAFSVEAACNHQSLASTRDWLLKHALEEMETERVCEIVNMGYSSFRKSFKDETGYAPHEYVLEVRLNRAKALLRQTDQTIICIAAEIGFASVFYFTRFFTRRVGCSPAEWRKTQGVLSLKGRKEQ